MLKLCTSPGLLQPMFIMNDQLEKRSILQYVGGQCTMYPTPEEYTAISCQLVKQHPILEHSFGCGFVSVAVRSCLCVKEFL